MKGGVGDQLKQQGNSINEAQDTIEVALDKAKSDLGSGIGSSQSAVPRATSMGPGSMGKPTIGGSRGQFGKPMANRQGGK